MGLVNLNIQLKYKNLATDLVQYFYKPVLRESVQYDRAVGYFTSDSLITLVEALKPFIQDNQGNIRLIISPFLTQNDLETLRDHQNYAEELVEDIFDQFLSNEQSLKSAQLLLLLLNKGFLNIKIAIPKNTLGLFHEKIAIFTDREGYQVAISGSNNETLNAITHNFESFNTFCSWKGEQRAYVENHAADFEHYWHNLENNLEVMDLTEAISSNFLKKFETEKTLIELFDDLIVETIDITHLNFNPYPHQIEGTRRWLENRQGILKYATGSGKTKTALYIINQLRQQHKKMFNVIVVPDKTLVSQWSDELKENDWLTFKCFSGNPNWNKEFKDHYNYYSIQSHYHVYAVVSANTFFGGRFQKELRRLKEDYFLVVDECHTWGTEQRLASLPSPLYRLGLSATPELFFSESKTERLLTFFGGIIHEYSLEDAIKEGFLVGYEYNPIFVSLNDSEKETYDEITRKIVTMIGQDTQEMKDGYDKALEMLLFKRARIVYGARAKLEYLESSIETLIQGGNLIIYAGPTAVTPEVESELDEVSMTQIEAVNELLARKGLVFAKYTSKETEEERKAYLKQFKNRTYAILTAIKCLDEGVDIPQVDKAIILASSTNPREFIQRRGRVLRLSPGKTKSIIYDFIVFDDAYDSLNEKEIKRLYEFASIAINKESLMQQHHELFERYIEGEK